MIDRKAKLEKALAFDRWFFDKNAVLYNNDVINDAEKHHEKNLAPLHAALLEAVEALEELQLGHSHKSGDEHIRLLGDNYGWCSFCQTKVNFGPGVAEEALSKIDKALGDV